MCREQPAIDIDGLTGDIVGLFGCQKGDHIGRVLRCPQPAQRNLCLDPFMGSGRDLLDVRSLTFSLFLKIFTVNVRRHQCRAHGIDEYIVWRQLEGQALGKTDHAEF